jgi:hypothetical protein
MKRAGQSRTAAAGKASAANTDLEQNSIAEKTGLRSCEKQGIEQIPTTHRGVAASQMERKGIASERGAMSREIRQTIARID